MSQTTGDPGGGGGIRTSGPSFAVRETTDGLRVLLTCSDPGDDATEIVDRVLNEIRYLDLKRPPSREEVEHRIHTGRRPGEDLVDHVLVEGRPPAESKDGWIEWARDFFAQGFAVDAETEVIDYWQRLENRSVEEGDTLAILHPPIRGEPGLNLHEDPVPSRIPQEATIRFGGNVKLEEEEDGTLVARAGLSGRVRWVESILSVDDVYTIGRSVDMEHGNVDHAGALVVRGDILHGATVRAKGDVIVDGIIEPSSVHAGGNLVVRGGIVGGEGFEVRVGGDLQARYLLDATVRVGGDVTISREVLNSRLTARGQLAIAGGRIIGGHVDALRGIEAGRIGTDGAKTRITVGLDPELLEEIAKLKGEIEKLEKRRAKIDSVLAPGARGGKPPSEETQKIIAVLTREASAAAENLAIARASLENALEQDQMNRDAVINVQRSVQEGTILEIHREGIQLDETHAGARTIRLEGREVTVGRYVRAARTRLTKP